MSVFLNSTPQEDGNLLNGSVAMHGGTGTYFVFEYSIVAFRDAPQYLEFAAGGQFVGIWDSYGTYLETGDTGYSFRWKIWARGTGTFALTQDTDPSWSVAALPATSIGTLDVDSVGYAVYHVDADPIDLTAFLDFDAIRLGLNLTSGAVDVTTIQLECVPDSGTTGWWVNQPSYDSGPYTATGKGAGSITLVDEFAPDRQDAWDAGYAAVLATNPANEPDPTVHSIDTLGALLSAQVPSWARSNPVLEPEDNYLGEFNMGVYKTWINASVGQAAPDGDEGVDYIRIPGYVIYDGDKAYTRSAANRNMPTTGHVVWDDPHAVYTSSVSFSGGDYHLTNLKIWFSVVEEDPHLDTDPIVWADRSTPQKTLTPMSTALQIDPISLPSSGVFAFYAFASALDEDLSTKPVLPDPGANVGAYFDGSMVVQSGDDGDFNQALPLYYTAHNDAYSVWDPFATPPAGGQLKVWLPSAEWRIIGDESGSDTERLKMRTPDNTWWKEYRSSDGAVTIHPLKIYTSDGWVFAANMTPD